MFSFPGNPEIEHWAKEQLMGNSYAFSLSDNCSLHCSLDDNEARLELELPETANSEHLIRTILSKRLEEPQLYAQTAALRSRAAFWKIVITENAQAPSVTTILKQYSLFIQLIQA
ncbi:hypothetical protein [Marinomonas balearica]|uniref:Uncharacterized protein n=1 Tax=Marinomonas balearica TaxID=491947 RepID=A0A4R6MAE8_9GAMM|nr:hypothetical protein [Marinomonas balearica]TDO98236.1 hypothetical protein DFP79_1877 [Marinomonas balearica]